MRRTSNAVSEFLEPDPVEVEGLGRGFAGDEWEADELRVGALMACLDFAGVLCADVGSARWSGYAYGPADRMRVEAVPDFPGRPTTYAPPPPPPPPPPAPPPRPSPRYWTDFPPPRAVSPPPWPEPLRGDARDRHVRLLEEQIARARLMMAERALKEVAQMRSNKKD